MEEIGDEKQFLTGAQILMEIEEECKSALDEENYNIIMEQLRDYFLSGNTDEKQFLIGDRILTINPKKTQKQILEEIEEEYQSAFDEENYLRVVLDNYYARSGVTTYYLILFGRYLLDFKRLVFSKGERGVDQIENCLDMLQKILDHLRKMQVRDILKTDRDLSIINENMIQIGKIPREE